MSTRSSAKIYRAYVYTEQLTTKKPQADGNVSVSMRNLQGRLV